MLVEVSSVVYVIIIVTTHPAVSPGWEALMILEVCIGCKVICAINTNSPVVRDMGKMRLE